jgi:glycosyltransferase involved in cell wall biosynthesis
MVRVCLPIWIYWPGLEGGSERQCRKMAHLLSARGVECEVLAARTSLAFPKREDDQGVTVRRFGVLCPAVSVLGQWVERWTGRFLGTSGADPAMHRQRAICFWLMLPWIWLARLSFMAEVSAYVSRHGGSGTLFHLYEPSWLGGFGVWLSQRTRGAAICQEATFPVLQTLGYDVPLRGRWRRLRLQAHYIAMAPHLSEALVAGGIPADRIFLLPNGVSLPQSAAAGGAGNREVLYVGNFSQGAHWKAFDVLIQAWAIVQRQVADARLTLVGGGDSTPWETLAARLGCRDSMVFAGRLERPDDCYRRAAIFVLPSRVEGMSNALLEAQSWGLPCVVSNIPGNTSVVSDGVNGLLTPVGDSPSLAAALIRLLNDPALRARLGAAARRRAEEEFSEERVATRLIGIYRALEATTAVRA